MSIDGYLDGADRTASPALQRRRLRPRRRRACSVRRDSRWRDDRPAGQSAAARPLAGPAGRAGQRGAAANPVQGDGHGWRATGPVRQLLHRRRHGEDCLLRDAPRLRRYGTGSVDVATVVDGGQPVDFPRLAEDLHARGVHRLMVEGGGTMHTQFLTAGLADELHLVVAPFFVGNSQARRFVSDGDFPVERRSPSHPGGGPADRGRGPVAVRPFARFDPTFGKATSGKATFGKAT